MQFRAEFEDVAIRGLLDISPGTLHDPIWKENSLCYRYDGADGLLRSLTIHFSIEPNEADVSEIQYQIRLKPKETKELRLTLVVAEAESEDAVLPDSGDEVDINHIGQTIEEISQTWLAHMAQFSTGSQSVNRVMNRSMRDLSMLRTHLGDREYFSAGIPWYAALFGRDAAITAIQTLAYCWKHYWALCLRPIETACRLHDQRCLHQSIALK